MPRIDSNINLGSSWEKAVMQIIPDIMYCSYATQRDNGMTHEQCMAIGLGRPEYETRYNQENKPS